jgi:hypothetical protein
MAPAAAASNHIRISGMIRRRNFDDMLAASAEHDPPTADGTSQADGLASLGMCHDT